MPTPDEMIEYFMYLDDLRASGRTNMFGARPYLADEYGLDRATSAAVHSEWMRLFDPAIPVADRARSANP